MKKLIAITFIFSTIQLHAQKLSSAEFYQKTKDTAAILLDVRTPEEYNSSHLPGAVNVNWNDSLLFKQSTALLNKNKPLLVYCLSGGRSAKAASQLRSGGYTVYELDGGIMQWRASKLPEITAAIKNYTSITPAEYDKLTNNPTHKVLVDFYAEWCEPCKLMEPYLKEIAITKSSTVKVIRIDVDKNPAIAQALNINAIPVLMLYEKNRLKWQSTGYTKKATVLKQL